MHSLQRRQTSRERPDPNRISKAQNRYILRRPADPRSNNVHRGRHSPEHTGVTLSAYQESRIRQFHHLYEQ